MHNMSTQSPSASIARPALLRGSVWRKWDLHVHTPLSVFNNQFPQLQDGPDWGQYLAVLEALTDTPVLGITDYFSIDGYRRLREFKSNGRLNNIQLLLPNIEFRLDWMIPTSHDPDDDKVKKINVHVIFSDLVAPEDIEDHFLRQLTFAALGDVQTTNEKWSLSRHQLEQLGKRLKAQHSAFSGSDYCVGCQNASVNFDDLKNVLHDHRSIFEGKYLIALARDRSISWDGQGHQQRKTLIRGSDAILSGQPNDRLWALGERGISPAAFALEFGSLKPCIHGSDAHELASIAKPAQDRFCWIKADTIFEGLRQITFEPAARVFIGDQPPTLKHPYRVIESVQITDAPDWFSYSPIPLNEDLIAIIGGKGAGKSALAEMIAFAGGSESFRNAKPRELQDTFLSKASKRSPSNMKPVIGAQITLRWKDGPPDTVKVVESLCHGQAEEKVKYLPQKFVEKVCAPENHADLVKEIERVIFQRISRSDRLGASTFDDLRGTKTKGIQVKKQHLANELQALNKEIYDAFEKVGSKSEKTKRLKELQKELQELQKLRPDVPAQNEQELKDLNASQTAYRDLEAMVTVLKAKRSTVDELEATLESIQETVEGFNLNVSSLLKQIDLESEMKSFEIVFPSAYGHLLEKKKADLANQIEALASGPRDGATLTSLELQIKKASDSLQLSKTKKLEFDKYETDRQALEEQIKSFTAEITSIETTVEVNLTTLRDKRVEKYLGYFDLLKEEKQALEVLYEPLRAALQQGGETDNKLKFTSRITFNAEQHAAEGLELLDTRRKGQYKDAEQLETEIKKVMASIDAVDYERDASRPRMAAFRETFLRDSSGNIIKFADQLKSRKNEEDFNNWFFGLEPYGVTYSITFEGRDLSLLSPGQKGIVLLLVYLEVDQDDQRPLIIDQPEDNLDNLSVYSNLIEFVRRRKCSRQILLITHNPNLVVNTDAEQILVATFDGSRNPKIMYRGGALEESSKEPPGVRELVCTILEGGTEAFQRREKKYSFS
jgi:hypothetical protein